MIFTSLLLCSLPSLPATAVALPPTQGKRDLLSLPEIERSEVICFALYTVSDSVLKMTAQLYPLLDGEDREVRLEVNRGSGWNEIQRATVNEDGWTSVFRVADWDDSIEHSYRLLHGESAVHEGTVRRNPIEKDEIVVVGFTGNSIQPAHGGDISREDLIANVQSIDADLLFFSGDQVYDHNRHYAAWMKFGRDFGPILRDRPVITIPDDHDVGQANLWGQSGKKSKFGAGHDGGYFKSPEYVRQVERAQTSHLPDPYDSTPVERGIGVYYTDLNWGGISFAIMEDRKFKTGPSGVIPKQGPRPDHILNPDYDPSSVDVAEAVLLGDRQLEFLDWWGQDWEGVEMKAALSQTIFCGGAHIHGKVGGRLHADLDSNGWPQTGRNKAISAMRKCFAVHFAGDQHLATIFQHGVDSWGDGNYSFCVPSIANLYLRWWDPIEEGGGLSGDMAPHLGEHLDGFGNHVTCHAVANPEPGGSGGKLSTRAAGFGVMRFRKSTREITMECWPRNVDISSTSATQYPGWPKTIAQVDNYGREATAYLPTLEITGAQNPVVRVVDESNGEWIYCLRILGSSFRPKVFEPGSYRIEIGEGQTKQVFGGVMATSLEEPGTLSVQF
jgi:hypothetical protein